MLVGQGCRLGPRREHLELILDAGHAHLEPGERPLDPLRARPRFQLSDQAFDPREPRLEPGDDLGGAQSVRFAAAARRRRPGNRIIRTCASPHATGFPFLILTAHFRNRRIVVESDQILRPETQGEAGFQRVDVAVAEGFGVRLQQGKHHALRTDRRIRPQPQRNRPQGFVLADRSMTFRSRDRRHAEHRQAHREKQKTANHHRNLNLERGNGTQS